MPPRRGRASTASEAASEPRRSSRKSITVLPPPPTPSKTKSTPKSTTKPVKKPVAKRGRTSKVVERDEQDSDELTEPESSEDELSSDDEETQVGKKRKTLSKPTKKEPITKKEKPARVIKPKPQRLFKQGLNPIPSLFTPIPLHSQFDQVQVEPIPEPRDAPRTVFVFGTGDMGQHGLGTDTLDEIKRPRRHAIVQDKIDQAEPGWNRGVGDLVCGGMHTLAIDADGKVWSWGINDNAALGRSTSKPGIDSEELEANPFEVEGLTGPNEHEFKAVRVAAGDSVSLAVSEQGQVKAWGSFRSAEGLLGFDGSSDSSKTQINPTTLKNLDKHSVVQIACGDDHFLALTSTGYVFACGNGEQNQLGRKIVQRHKTHGLTPERLALKNIVLVGTGSYHSFAVTEAGQVYAWGSNSFHQTGVADEDGGYQEVIETPTLVRALDPAQHDGARVVQIAAGAHHSLFLLSNGQVWAVGRTDGHEVGVPDSHEEMKQNELRKDEARKQRQAREQIELEQRFDKEGNVTARDEDGELLTKEQAEFEAKEHAAKAVPLPNDYVENLTRLEFPKEPKTNDPSFKADDFDEDTEIEPVSIVSIASGTRHNFAVSARGYVYSWGVGPSSQLGQGNEEEVETPTRIWNTALSNVRVIKAETGGQHSVLVGVDRDWQDKLDKRTEAQKAQQQQEAEDDKKQESDQDHEGNKEDEKKESQVNGDSMQVDGQGDEEKKE
ncbi:RCC1 domain-containing protein [Sporobolomyces koalae]|uniref:RCC1 domain-containing protein n=1 Tax=Sporobolomyces koalae TaxID=500713 RepID=UPI0031722E8E